MTIHTWIMFFQPMRKLDFLNECCCATVFHDEKMFPKKLIKSKALPVLLVNGGSVKKTAMVWKNTPLSNYLDSLINVYHHKLDQIQG